MQQKAYSLVDKGSDAVDFSLLVAHRALPSPLDRLAICFSWSSVLAAVTEQRPMVVSERAIVVVFLYRSSRLGYVGVGTFRSTLG